MEQRHKDRLQSNFDFLLDNLMVTLKFVAYLHKRRIILLDEKEELQLGTSETQVNKFYDTIVRKGPRAFDVLLEALDVSGQSFIKEKLLEDLPPREARVVSGTNDLEIGDLHFLLANVDINSSRQEGVPVCQLAVDEGRLTSLSYLIRHGADIHVVDENGQTLLHRAAELTQCDAFCMLAGAGLSVESQDALGQTPLHMAILAKSEAIVSYLLTECVLDVNMADNRNRTALHLASEMGDLRAVQQLLAKGASCDTKTHVCGITPLDAACYVGHLKVVDALMRAGADVNVERHDGTTPLFVACQNGHTDIVELLVQRGADVNGRDNRYGCTPLWIACQNGHVSAVYVLLINQARVDYADYVGATPLWKACENGHTDVVNALLRCGACVNTCTEKGTSALHIACEKGHSAVVATLLSEGAEVTLVQHDGSTPAGVAAEHGHVDIVEMLTGFRMTGCFLRKTRDLKDSNVNMPRNTMCIGELRDLREDDDSPSEIRKAKLRRVETEPPQKSGRPSRQVYPRMVEHAMESRNQATELHKACLEGTLDDVLNLLHAGAKVNARDPTWETPLHLACDHDVPSKVTALLQFGADVNSRGGPDEATPLHRACHRGCLRVAKHLLKCEAQVNALDANGQTPMQVAVAAGHSRIIELLLDHGASMNARDVQQASMMKAILQ